MGISQSANKRGRPRDPAWQRLSHAIQSRGWTQANAAKFLGVTQAAISDWERGKAAPKFAQWPTLAPFLGLTVPELGAEIGVIFFTRGKKDILYNANLPKIK